MAGVNLNMGPPSIPWNCRPESSNTTKALPSAGPAETVETSTIRESEKSET